MIKKTFFALICLFLVVGIVFAEADKKDKGIKKGATVGYLTWFDINNLMFAVQNNGAFSYDPVNDHAGFYYPKGTGTAHTVIYQDGLVWGGRVHEDHDSIRVGGSAYIQGLQEGKVIAGKPDDPTKAKYRVYRIRKDWKDATDITASDRVQYQKDYDEWPKDDGAPVGADGKPLFLGDQVLWYVANDFNDANTLVMYGSPHIGIEQQVTVWGYNQPGALGNLAFKRYIFINKGGKRVDSMFVSQWADCDNGQSDNDVVGCDSVLGLGYTYNGVSYDAQYGYLSPSAGFDFFQGARVASPSDSGIWMGKRIKGYKNLGMTSFALFDRTVAAYGDPPQGTYTGTIQWWNLLRGLQGVAGTPFMDPKTNTPNKFVGNGDPVKKTGWIDGVVPVPGDRRQCQNSGPFTLAAGDTQEVVVAYVAAQGTDRLSSVALMKFYDQQAQLAYDNFFNVPGPPPPPKLSVAEMDAEIVLSWGDPVQAPATESYNNGGYKFEGYNVYQMPGPTVKSKADAKLIATYDIPNNNVTVIVDKDFDPATGLVLDKPVQFGNDANGVKRSIVITQDWINGVPLVNHQRYYFAITAYAFNSSPTAIPNNLENSLVAIIGSDGNQGVVPQGPKLGVRLAQAPGDTLALTHTAGVSEGVVVPLVLNPVQLNGHTYEVSFDGAGKWFVKDQTAGTTSWTGNTTDTFFPDISGVNVSIVAPPIGYKGAEQGTANEGWNTLGTARWWTQVGTENFAAEGIVLEGFRSCIGWGGTWPWGGTSLRADQIHNVLIEFAETDLDGNLKNPSDANMSMAYRYMRASNSAAAKPAFAPFIVNTTANYMYQDRRPMCMKVTDLETGKRLDVGFFENNAAAGMVDGKYWPPDGTVTGTDNTATTASPREWFFIFGTEYNVADKPELKVSILSPNPPLPFMAWGGVTRRGAVAPTAGAKFRMNANHPFAAADKYTFTAAAPTFDQATAVGDVAKINVFPNPYFGFNRKETDKARRFVTFTHLPQKAKIRVFSLAGTLVKTVLKDDATQYAQWDLRNETGLPVASGMYIVHIDMTDVGMGNRILKVAIIQEAQFLDQVQTGNL